MSTKIISTNTNSQINSTLYWSKIAFFCILFLVLPLLVYGPSGDDDSYITFSAAEKFAQEGKILNINNDKVEQGSSLLHVLILGFMIFLTKISATKLGYAVSLLFSVLCVPLIIQLCNILKFRSFTPTLTIIILSVSYSYWSAAGLESSLFCFSLIFFTLCIHRSLAQGDDPLFKIHIWASASMVLMSRPESFLLLISTLIALFFVVPNVINRKNTVLLKILFIVTLLSGILFYWRYSQFSSFFPQPVYAKSDGISLMKIFYGLGYFLYSLQASIIIFSIVNITLFIRIFFKRTSPPILITITSALTCSYIAFIVLSGGDWMSGGRFFAPIIPFLVINFLWVLKEKRIGLGLVITLMIFESIFFSIKVSSGIPFYKYKHIEGIDYKLYKDKYSYYDIYNLVHARDLPLVEKLDENVDKILRQTDEPVTILSIQMGIQPYFLINKFGDNVNFVDMRGLVTKHITDCKEFALTERRWTGVFISYEDYFGAINECDLPYPDIIYDLLNRDSLTNKQRIEIIL